MDCKKNISTQLCILVLKGGISNCKYIWHSENSENTCEECAALDGTEYSFEDEVPERPHPNCQCTVEIIENDSDSTDEDEENICEDSIAIQAMLLEVDSATSEVQSIEENVSSNKEEINSLIFEIQNFSKQVESARAELIDIIKQSGIFADDLKKYFSDLYIPIEIAIIIEYGQEVLYVLEEVYASCEIFNDYKSQLKVLKDAGLCDECTDKIYHANANYDCTKRGQVGELTSIILSILKEIYDLFKKVPSKEYTFKQAWDDSMNDLRADWYGIQKAKEQINSEKDLPEAEIRDIFFPKK